MIPGQNILNMAFRVIAQTSVVYYHYLGRTQNSVGQDVSQYSLGKKVSGSLQPIQRILYQQYGLDLQKDYYFFYASNNTNDVSRNVSGDQIAFNGQRYQCESNNDWFSIDGWKGSIFVHIGIDTADDSVWGFGEKPSINTNQNFSNGTFLGGTD